MDYLDHVRLVRHVSWADFEAWRREAKARLVLLTTRPICPTRTSPSPPATSSSSAARAAASRTRSTHAADARLVIPIAPGLRSLNVATAAAMVLGEALRQTGGFPATAKA